MGASASMLPERLSEREVMSLAGDKFDKELFDSLKDSNGLITKEQLLSAANSTERRAQEMFMRFAPSGDMDSKSFNKLCRDTGLLDNIFTSGDADIAFSKAKTKVSSSAKSIPYEIFRYSAVPSIAAKKSATEEFILLLIGQGEGPKLNATRADNVRLHDDKSTYTGAHAQGGPSFKPENTGVLSAILDRSEADIRGVKVEKLTADQHAEARARKGSKADLAAEGTGEGQSHELTAFSPTGENEPEAKNQFMRFCPEGEMDSKTFVKLCRDTGLINSVFRVEDADLIFQKAKTKQSEKQGSTAKSIRYNIFRLVCVPSIAAKRNATAADVLLLLANAEGPTFNATKAEYNKFHDDKNLYTGSHAQGGPSFRVEDQSSLGQQVERRGSSVAENTTSPIRRASNAGLVDASPPKTRGGTRRDSEAAAALQEDPSRRPSAAGNATSPTDVTRRLSGSGGEVRPDKSRAGSRRGSRAEEVAATAAAAVVRRPSMAGDPVIPVRKASLDMGNGRRVSTSDPAARRGSQADGAGARRGSRGNDGFDPNFDRSAGALRGDEPDDEKQAAAKKIEALARASAAKNKVSSMRYEKYGAGEDTEEYAPSGTRLERLREAFLKFAPSGEMSSAQFIKMMRDSHILNKSYTAGDAELIYMKAKQRASGGGTVAAGQKVSFDLFVALCIPAIASKRGETVENFAEILSGVDGPVLNATTAEYNKFHDDKNTYTGTHATGGPAF